MGNHDQMSHFVFHSVDLYANGYNPVGFVDMPG